jgi:hypothetical protein
MKKLFVLLTLFLTTTLVAQDDMKPINNVTITIAGLGENNVIGKSKLEKLEKLELAGAEAKKYKIVSYTFNYIGEKGITRAGMERDEISKEMTEFFQIIEKDCRISFSEVLVRNTETTQLYKIASLVVNVHANE